MQKIKSNYFTYFLFSAFLCIFSALLLIFDSKEDHPGEISLNNDHSWYMNFKRTYSLQLQDRDIFFHNIGNSLKFAKQADIIILGHSMVLFGLDWRMLQNFSKKYHIKIYNMSFASDASGEFALRIIEKYHLHPAIFILNADDHEISFFAPKLKTGKDEAADVVSYSRWHAYKNVIGKNLRWKLEAEFQQLIPKSIDKILYPAQQEAYTYRSIENGNWNNDYWPKYNIRNPIVHNQREPDCHAKQEEFDWAAQYTSRLKNPNIILTLIPYINSCRPRVKEIADRLQKPFISIEPEGMSYFDGSGHLDSFSAKKATLQFLTQLEQLPSFKKLIENKKLELSSNSKRLAAEKFTHDNKKTTGSLE